MKVLNHNCVIVYKRMWDRLTDLAIRREAKMWSCGRAIVFGVATALGGCTVGEGAGTALRDPSPFEQQVISLAAAQCGFQPTPGTVRKVAAGLGSSSSDPAAIAETVCRAA